MSLSKQNTYLIRVDIHKNWTPNQFREVTADELDDILKFYGDRILQICSNGTQGAMTMWAVFKSRINHGCYSDIINAYRMMSGDSKSLVDREHELRHAWKEYEELWQIRYHGSVENYHLEKAKQAKNVFAKSTTCHST